MKYRNKFKILRFINSNPKWRAILTAPPYNLILRDFGDYTLIKYNQLFSNFKEDMVKEARGLIIKKVGRKYTPVCIPFTKFFCVGDPNAKNDLYKLYHRKQWHIEQKIDGCFPYNTLVTLEDGSSIPIGQIVNQQMNVKVLSYNMQTNKIEPKRVIGWNKKNSEEKEWLCITCDKASKKIDAKKVSSVELQLTKNHKVFVEDVNHNIVEKSADELVVGDKIYNHITSLSSIQEQVILGGILGDSSFRHYNNKEYSNGIIMRHSLKQKDYVKYKNKLLGELVIHYKEYEVQNSYKKEKVEAWTYSNQAISKIYQLCTKDNHKYITKEWLEKLNWLGIAIWYMDDGSLNVGTKNPSIYFHTEGYSKEENETIINFFSHIGIKAYLRRYKTYYFVAISTNDSNKIWENIKTFIPDSMQYKLPLEYQGYFENIIDDEELSYELNSCVITKIEQKCNPVKMNGGCKKFDLQIEDNSNYFADGILVHNSLIKLWHDNDEWHISTSGTIQAKDAPIQFEMKNITNYEELFLYASKDKIDWDRLDRHYTYLFELVGLENKVIVPYEVEDIYYLGRRNNYTFYEVPYMKDDCAGVEKCKRPKYKVIDVANNPKKMMEQLQQEVNNLTKDDEHFEGYVISDEGLKTRVKMKSSKYMELFFQKGNGIFTPRKILLMILDQKDDDVISSFPEYKPQFDTVRRALCEWLESVKSDLRYMDNTTWETKKDFAEWAKQTTNSAITFAAYNQDYWADGWLEDKVRSIQIDNLVKYIGIEERKDEIDV